MVANAMIPKSNSDDAEVVKLATIYEVKNNKLLKTDTIVIQIDNRLGEDFTNISIPYSKNERISNIDGWIEDLNGKKLRNLQKSDINDRSAISDMSLYEDNFVKSFQLKHNTYPYRVCYTYKITINQFISIADWSPVIYQKIPTIEAKLTVIYPNDSHAKTFKRNVLQLQSDTLENIVKSVYTSKYDKIDLNETYAIPFGDIKPRLIIIPERFNYGIEGSTKDWKSYGEWFNNLNKGLNDLPESEKSTINQLIAGYKDQSEIIKILYHYMQDHTRYINVSIGIGGLKAFPASYVSVNKYGDCKALTNYMKAILEFAGIKSNFVLINRSTQPEKLIEELPFPQFNHIILAVPVKKDTIWIENTENAEPYSYLGSTIQNRKALLIEENNSRIISVPSVGKKGITLVRTINIYLNQTENAGAQINFSFRGIYYELFNSLISDYNKNEQDNIIKEYMPFTNYEVIEWKLNNANRDSANVELVSKLNLYKIKKQLGDDYYFNTFPIKTGLSGILPERKLPLLISYPINNNDSVTYLIPDGLEVKSAPEHLLISTFYGSYEITTKWDANKIYVSKKYELFPNKYSTEQYKAFYGFYNSVKDAEKKLIVLKRKI